MRPLDMDALFESVPYIDPATSMKTAEYCAIILCALFMSSNLIFITNVSSTVEKGFGIREVC